MILLAFSESKGRAAIKAARILDSYLPRLGRHSWSGRISMYGFRDIEAALKKVATRGFGVALHRTAGGGQAECISIIGERRFFGRDGRVPVVMPRKPYRSANRTSSVRLMDAIVGLAASFHDLGKTSAAFDRVLRDAVKGKRSREPLRHEMVSLALLRAAMAVAGDGTDQDMLSLLAQDGGAARLFGQAWGRVPVLLKLWTTGSETDLSLACLLPDRNANPVLRSIADLVLSHHRLPNGGYGKTGELSYGSNNHVRVKPESKSEGVPLLSWKDALTPAAGAMSGPGGLSDPCWGVGVQRDASRALDALSNGEVYDPRYFSGALHHWGRLALIIGDITASDERKVARPDSEAVRESGDGVHAKTWDSKKMRRSTDPWAGFIMGEKGEEGDDKDFTDIEDMPEGLVLGDLVSVHTHKVRTRARLALAHALCGDEGYPHMNDWEMSGLVATRSEDLRYAWQDTGAEVIRNAMGEGGEHDPDAGLVFLLAGTGNGKTIAAPKVLLALRRGSGLRATVALGLRSLTLQTGDEYVSRMGFDSRQVAVVVGSATARRIHSLGEDVISPTEAEEAFSPGTDAQCPLTPDLVLGGDVSTVLPLLAEHVIGAERYESRSRRRRLLSAPLLVCTIDTLMSVADARRTSYVSDALRLMTSDLVVDEIDSFSVEDLHAICRLIRAAAAYGRNVVVSSATLRPEHALVIWQAFAAGRKDREALLGVIKPFMTAWLSQASARYLPDARTEEAFLASHTVAAHDLSGMLSQAPVLRRAASWPVLVEGHGETALEAVRHLHNSNHVVDYTTGVRVSIGFVRWNRVRRARDFTTLLLGPAGEREPSTRIAALCMHAKFPVAVRATVDKLMNSMLSRKCARPEDDPILLNPVVRGHIAECVREEQTDLIMVVSATPVIEAGRDLDVDWSVTEPCSERSAIQLAGRIRRHRPWACNSINLLIMDTAEPDVFARGDIAKPGIDTVLPCGAGLSRAVRASPGRRTASDMFPLDIWKERLDASSCLIESSSMAGRAEVAILRLGLLGIVLDASLLATGERRALGKAEAENAAKFSLSAWLNSPSSYWTALFPSERRFRRKEARMIDEEFAILDEKWMARDAPTRREKPKAGILLPGMPVGWTSADSRVKRRMIDDTPNRLLLPAEIFEPEVSAAHYENMFINAGEDVSERERIELRTTYLSLNGDDAAVIDFVPWLGMEPVRSK